MSNLRARTIVFLVWGCPFVLMVFLFELAPAFRRGVIAPGDAHAALIKMAALYVPILTAFSTYWFRRSPDMAEAMLSPERWVTAIGISIAYQLIVFVLLVYATYLEPYATGVGGDDMPPITFNEWITNILQVGLLISPCATAPAAYLLGVEKIEVVQAATQ